MVIPLPAVLIDLLLALSISLALVILMVSMYTQQPLEFSTFPSVLLVVTLFRLALNVASTRLILLHGHEGSGAAGHVIRAFGNFVVGGSYVVGLVVFLILVVINFAVITKGAGRIAEVAARFTLDAMPGKQLAIDADLNSGLITEKEARGRRRAIEEEADFYGAMDGASKFVRGDAVAGLVITAINILGGFFIGVVQQGADVKTAAETYTILTIGDGLVSQLPALLISTAAGIIVTRAASGADLGSEVAGQLLTSPRVLWLVSGILGAFALLPGLPFLPFIVLAGATGGLAAARGELRTGCQLAIAPGTVRAPVTGIATREPAFGLDALWIAAQDRERAQLAGYTVVDPATVVITHLTEVIRRHAHELLGRQEVQQLLDAVAKTRPKVVEELVPQQLTVGGVQKVLQNLLREGVSIRDLVTVLETLADHAPRIKDADALTEHVRQALGRSITKRFLGPDGTLALVTLGANLERLLLDSVKRTDDGPFLALEPALAQRLLGRLAQWIARFGAQHLSPLLLCSTPIRAHVRRLVERVLPSLAVVSPGEIGSNVRLRSLGVVTLDEG